MKKKLQGKMLDGRKKKSGMKKEMNLHFRKRNIE